MNNRGSLASLLIVFVMFTPFEVGAQTGVQYAVKFICGKSLGRVVAPGIYFTAINVHNTTDKAIGFQKKFAIALPEQRPGPQLFSALSSAQMKLSRSIALTSSKVAKSGTNSSRASSSSGALSN